MRRILPLALMFLLVLRGLMGTAMAAEFVPELTVQGQAAQSSLLHAQATTTANHAPHAMATEQGAAPATAALAACHDTAGEGFTTPHEHNPVCSACDICHSALLTPPALPAQPAHTASQVRPLATAAFASAQTALAIKPPIL